MLLFLGLVAAQDSFRLLPGQSCEGEVTEMERCNLHGCADKNACEPVDATWEPWGEWHECSCNHRHERYRNIAHHHKCGGQPIGNEHCKHGHCEHMVENGACEPDPSRNCPPDEFIGDAACEFGEWLPWGEGGNCEECGMLQETRHRHIKTAAMGHGAACEGSLTETQDCDHTKWQCAEDTPVNGEFGEWQAWTECTTTCDGGQRERHRTIKKQPVNGGEVPSGATVEIEACAEECCEERLDCDMDQWSEWGGCTAECGGGTQDRSREIRVNPKNNGKECTCDGGPCALREHQACNQNSCEKKIEPVNGEFSEWGTWSECSQECGGGYTSRTRSIKKIPTLGGKWLDEDTRTEQFEKCNEDPCDTHAVDCVLSTWTEWNPDEMCTCQCNGVMTSQRHIEQHAMDGGKICDGALQQTKACMLPDDPGNTCDQTVIAECEWSKWTAWGECSKSCAGGTRTRVREIENLSSDKNAPKPDCNGPREEVDSCNMHACYILEPDSPVNCEWNEWHEWGACTHSESCTKGIQHRYRSIKQYAANGGDKCESTNIVEVQPCGDCHERACIFKEWAPWSKCSAECDGGFRERTKVFKAVEKGDKDWIDPPETTVEYAALATEAEQLRLTYASQQSKLHWALGSVAAAGLVLGVLSTRRNTPASYERAGVEMTEPLTAME